MAESKCYKIFFSFAGYCRSDKLKYKLPSWYIDMSASMELTDPFFDMYPQFDTFPSGSDDGGSRIDYQNEESKTRLTAYLVYLA
jgi:hypothetical protein